MSTHFQSLLQVLAKYWKRYLIGILALLVTDLGIQVMPWQLGKFFNELQAGTLTTDSLWRYLGLIGGAALVVAVTRYVWRIYVFGTARHVERDIRESLFAKLQQLSSSFYHRKKTGDLMAMATNDLQAVRAAAGEGIMMTADSVLMTIITMTAMVMTVGWKLSLLAILPLPILVIAAALLSKLMYTRSRAVQDAFGTLSDVTQENISGMRVIKAFGQERPEESKFDTANRQYLRRFVSMVRIQGAIEPTIQMLAGLCIVLAMIFPGRAVLRGEIPLGSFASMIFYLSLMVWPMIAMGWVVSIWQRAMGAFARIQEVMFEPPAVTDSAHPVMPAGDQIRGQIEVRNLTFSYGGAARPALSAIDVSLRPGETLGIIGRTGSGKSTLVSLLARSFNPPRSTIFVDGVDVLDLPLTALRQAIAFVPQESFLFSRTVGENIAFAPGDWTKEDVSRAARTCQVEQDILEFLPEGYETMVGERGVTLSGGQRQRVGLSRAVLKDAPILVLDDCLSAVDTSTEQRILGGLRPVMQDRTTIVISHRVAAVKAADRIIVLEEGRIIESGTHDELLALRGKYYRTFQRQQLEEAIANAE